MRRLLAIVPLLLIAACGSDGGSEVADGAASETSAVEPTASDATASDTTASDVTASEGTAADDVAEGSDGTASESDDAAAESDDAPPPAGGNGGAVLTLANGETFEFPTVLCSLESQMAAGSEILFTATSYDDPGLDITQFGDEGTITGVASISVYNGDYDTLWEANSMFGSTVELTLDGSTIRGTGSFIEGGDMANEPVAGEVVANC